MFDVSVSSSPAAESGARCMERLEAARRRVAQGLATHWPEEPPASGVELAGAVAWLNSIDWDQMDGATTMATVVELETARRALDSALATGMEHLDRSGATVAEHGLGAHSWLPHQSRGSRDSAKRAVALGRVLSRFERFADAIRHGELSTDHAMALHAVSNSRIADLLVRAEETLLEMARTTSFAAFRRNLRVIARQLDEDGAEPDCSDRDELSLSSDSKGALHLRGRLSGHQAAVFEKAVRDEYDRQWRSAQREHRTAGVEVPSPAVLRARALVEIVRRGLAGDPATNSKPRTEVLLVMEHDSWHTDDGEPLDSVTAAVLACDAWYQPLVIDPISNTPLFVGRGSRYATREQRRALIVRDGGCAFPGCDAPASWCDAHHIIPWDDGGLTDLDNLALLCRRHHGYAHSKEWLLEAIPVRLLEDGRPAPKGTVELVWHTPRGTVAAQRAGDRACASAGSAAASGSHRRRTAA